MSTAETATILRKEYIPAETNFTPGEKSFVAWITMDVVDNEGDVVVPTGVDCESVYLGVHGDPSRPGNPVVMAIHDYQRWPLGICEWIKVARPSKRLSFSGLYSKTLIDEDPDAVKVFGMIQRKVVRGISIGFRPPDDFKAGEWAPPTAKEIEARPEWKLARRIIRRCVLLEYSVVPIPMNQSSLIVAVSKGLELPSYLKDIAMADEPNDFAPGMHVKHTKSGVCGVIKSLHSDGHVPDADTDLREDKEAPAALVDLHAKRCKPTGKTAAYTCKDMGPIEPEPADETEKRLAQAILKRIVHHGDKWTVVSEDGSRTMGTYGTEAEAVERLRQVEGHKLHDEGKGLPFEVGHHVVIHKAMGGGCGVVKSLHTHGTVPGIIGEHPVHASEETPAARVEMHDHECMGIGVHKAFHTKHLLPIVDGELNDQPGTINRPDADGPLAKGMVPYKSYPESTAAWDAGKARQQFKDRATTKGADGEGETVDYDKYGEGFACSTGDGEKLGDFRYPHHYVEAGKIVTVRQGVASAIAACHGARSGATPEGAADAMQHLMKHAKELELPIAEDGKSLDWEELAAGTGWTRKSLMKGMAESSGTAGGYTTKPGTDADPDLQGPDVDDLTGLDDDDEDETPIRKGDPVHWDHHKGVPAGLGRVKSIHTTGRVPGAANEAEASDEEPHARIERYKDMGHPLHFHASGEHVAIPVTKCRKMLTMEVHPAVKGYGEQVVAWHRIADTDHLVTLHDLPAATKGVVPFREGTVVDAPWDASRAASRVKGFAAENLARALKCYAWFDERKANDQGCWWGLHHDIEVATGRLVVNREACRKLLATLDSAELPASDKAAIREHLEKHLASAGITEPAPVAPVLPVVKTAAEWETELLKHLAATGAAPPSPESQIADIVAGVEKRLYGAID